MCRKTLSVTCTREKVSYILLVVLCVHVFSGCMPFYVRKLPTFHTNVCHRTPNEGYMQESFLHKTSTSVNAYTLICRTISYTSQEYTPSLGYHSRFLI